MRINKKGQATSGTMTVAGSYDQAGMMPSASYLDDDDLADAMDLGLSEDMDPDMDFLDMVHPMYASGGPNVGNMYPMYVGVPSGDATGYTGAAYSDDMMPAAYTDDYYVHSPPSVASTMTVSTTTTRDSTITGDTLVNVTVAGTEATPSSEATKTESKLTAPNVPSPVMNSPVSTVGMTPPSDLLKSLMTQSAIPSSETSTVSLSSMQDLDVKSSSGAKPKHSFTQRSRIDWSSDEGSISQGDNPKYAGRLPKMDVSEFEKFANPPPKQRKNVDVDSVIERNRKNAIQARMNRQRKKEMMQSLEQQVNELSDENTTLKTENASLREERDDMAEEIQYLKNVLANESMLSRVLHNIGQVSEVRLSKAFTKKRKSGAEGDLKFEHSKNHSSSTDCQKCKDTLARMGAGVCLHVENNDVSLEFCAKCAKMAKSGAP